MEKEKKEVETNTAKRHQQRKKAGKIGGGAGVALVVWMKLSLCNGSQFRLLIRNVNKKTFRKF